MSPLLVVAVPAAVLAAACFGSAGFLQHRATHKTVERKPLEPGLLVDLIKLTEFRVAVLLGALGFLFQVLALRYGPLILVQPLLVTGVLFYLITGAVMRHDHPDGRLVAGALTALAGLSVFLVVARPSGGRGSFTGGAALPLGIALIIIVAACLVLSNRLPVATRALPLAVATAVCYGVTAGLVRTLASGGAGTQIFGHWQLYAVMVVGPAGFLLNQNAYQQGRLGSVSLAIITIGDPIVSIGIGVAWLGEVIGHQTWSIAVEVIALAVMIVGVVLLARRANEVGNKLQHPDQGAENG